MIFFRVVGDIVAVIAFVFVAYTMQFLSWIKLVKRKGD